MLCNYCVCVIREQLPPLEIIKKNTRKKKCKQIPVNTLKLRASAGLEQLQNTEIVGDPHALEWT